MPPKKPYSFLAMLDNILVFAAQTLVDDGRLSFWMPSANDEEQEIAVPTHPCLEIVVICVQTFNKCKSPLHKPPKSNLLLTVYHRVEEAHYLPPATRLRGVTRLFGGICGTSKYHQHR